ncbi:uncharacterized protein LOC143595641 [Bidens hawaiensis]|uniref:uncharacterized protein LOC143595641 n=1 Tax=Bidens hawaiensis TaxID=980011 RepID=UPI0040491376
MTPNGPADVPLESLIDNDKKLMLNYEKAYGVISVCLSTDIAQTLRECTAAKGLWDALVEKFEGNLDMKESRIEMLNGEFNMFNHIQGKTVTSLLNRFEALNNMMRSVGIIKEMSEINKKLLNSLPYTWNSGAITIKRTTNMNTKNTHRVDLYNQII